MRMIWNWFFLSCKRYIQKPVFLIVLLLLPIGSYLLSVMEKTEDSSIKIAIYTEDGRESFASQVERDLVNRRNRKDEEENGMFSFYSCESERQLQEDVATRRAECGYVFYRHFEERLEKGQYKRCIGVYVAPSTVTDVLAQEIIFSALIRRYNKKLLMDYVKGQHTDVEQRVGELYDQWIDSGKTFQFQFKESGESRKSKELLFGAGENLDTASTIFPVRGFVSVFLFLAGLYSAVFISMDEKKGLFFPIPSPLRLPCKLACMFAFVSICAVSGFLAICLSAEMESLWREVISLVFYVFLLVITCYTLKLIIRNDGVLESMIPFFLIGSLVFCPVFVDIGHFFPEFRYVGMLFLPYYYLRM